MTYIIGEIGQNHNGSVDLAKVMIDLANRPIRDELFDIELPKINAIKLTKRDLSQELTKSQMEAPYVSPHSFGKTYGEHRAALELNNEQHEELFHYAKDRGFDLVETICSVDALKILDFFRPDYLKVASRDLTNLPLLEAMADTAIPMIISTGMADQQDLDEAIEVISAQHSNISILHCVSEYPTHPQNVNLNTIDYLRERYPKYTVGYSDHTIGISAPIAAVAKGAKVIEKHITIDRDLKGTDQKGSLGPDGLRRMVRDIRLLELSMGERTIFMAPSANAARRKLERSIAARRDLEAGHVIKLDDIHLLSPGDGLQWRDRGVILGKTLKDPVPQDELIHAEDVL